MTTVLPAKVLIVDDHPLVRAGFRQLISDDPDLQVCGEATDGQSALALAKRQAPDIIVADLSLSSGSGLKLIKRLRLWNPRLKILVVSMFDELLFAERALQAGAMGYVHKREAAEKVIKAVHHVLNGKVFLSPPMVDRLLSQDVGGTAPPVEASPVATLSDRELEVFELIGRGRGTTEIAEQLHLSVKTIETHRAHIKKKLKLTTANELLRKAMQWTMEP